MSQASTSPCFNPPCSCRTSPPTGSHRTRHLLTPYSIHKKASYVDYLDIAEAAALALTGSALDYGTFELCARGMVNRIELTQLMSEVLGKPIKPLENTFDAWVATAHVLEGPYRDGMQRMFADYDQFGFPGGNALILRAILGREPRTLRAFLEEQASGGRN